MPEAVEQITGAEQEVMRALAYFHRQDVRWVKPVDIAARARLSEGATIAAVRSLAMTHRYVTPRGGGHLWSDGISLTTLGEPVADKLALETLDV